MTDQSDIDLQDAMQRSRQGESVFNVARTSVPNMIGDLGGGSLSYVGSMMTTRGSVPLAGGDRNFKIAENNNPRPTNRVFFNFNHFQNSLVGSPGRSRHHVDRFVFGMERTFLDDLMSFEFRIPFADGLNSTQDLTAASAVEGTEFGNIPLVFKGVLLQDRCWMLSGGLAVILPTGSDAVELDDDAGTTYQSTLVENEAVHLQPFLGWLWTPNEWFAQAFVQADFDANGHSVTTRSDSSTISAMGALQEQSLLMFDLKIGRWVYRNPCASFITGIAPAVELHYTTTMQDSDSVGIVGNPHNRVDLLNLTAGIHVGLGDRSDLTFFASAPLKGERIQDVSGVEKHDIAFDAEVGLQFNYRY